MAPADKGEPVPINPGRLCQLVEDGSDIGSPVLAPKGLCRADPAHRAEATDAARTVGIDDHHGIAGRQHTVRIGGLHFTQPATTMQHDEGGHRTGCGFGSADFDMPVEQGLLFRKRALGHRPARGIADGACAQARNQDQKDQGKRDKYPADKRHGATMRSKAPHRQRKMHSHPAQASPIERRPRTTAHLPVSKARISGGSGASR